MKLARKNKNLIVMTLIGAISLYFGFFGLALASEINKDNIIYLVNQSRKDNNVAQLEENQKLDQAAKEKAEDMIKNNYFAHTSPGGVTPWYWFEKNDYDYKYAGENLALGFSSSENQHKAWMESPTHKKNILNQNYQEIGVAVESGIINDNQVTIAVQMFGTSSEGINGKKEENNIPDNKSDDLLEKNKKDNKGIVLNTENPGPSKKIENFSINKEANPWIDFSKFKDFVFGNNGFLNKSIFMISATILAICLVFNLMVAMILVFHNVLNHLRDNKDIFTLVNSILIFLLVGSIVF